jgi:YARHG domain
MRLTMLLATMAVAAATLLMTAPSADAQSCQQLWVERNSYYKRAGFCFKTQRAIAYFGNGGCVYWNEADVPLAGWQRQRIAQIRRAERAYGCDD